MIKAKALLNYLTSKKIYFYTGVPDSILKNFTNLIDKKKKLLNIKAVNEGAAVAMAVGNYLSTKKIPCVYFQNSGLGNAINPLVSIASSKVYSIPLFLIIGWRGAPSIKDEPQHVLKGQITPNLLKLIKIKHAVIESEKDFVKIGKILRESKKKNCTVAILIKMNSLKNDANKKIKKNNIKGLRRIYFIEKLLNIVPKNIKIISTTGYASRELNYLREKNKNYPIKDFYMVGGMGHSSMVSLGVSINKKVVCLDGDGSLLMHMGSMRSVGYYGNKNYKHILLNNGCHESVGGQITTSTGIDFKKLSQSLGYKGYCFINSKINIEKKIKSFLNSNGPTLLEVKIKIGSIENLGRPSNFLNIKNRFMK